MKPELSDYGKKGYDGPMNEKSVNMALSPMGERSMKEQLRNCHSIDDLPPHNPLKRASTKSDGGLD